jgi:hypothetical protein
MTNREQIKSSRNKLQSKNSKRVQMQRLINLSLGFGFALSTSLLYAASPITLNLSMGKTANYGATSWYTSGIAVGSSHLRFALDSGSNFIWATSDQCNTDACNTHNKVDTTQTGFKWLNLQPTIRSFGPWGSMTTRTGQYDTTAPATAGMITDPFFTATDYRHDQFKYLDWDGGIGFPSRSDAVENGSGFYLETLLKTGLIRSPSFAVVTDTSTRAGVFLIGAEDSRLYNPNSKVNLPPDTSGSIDYIWGTTLYQAGIGSPGNLPSLNNARFYLDTGSSVFKGDAIYIQPILTYFISMQDSNGQPIFQKLYDQNGQWTGLGYANGKAPSSFPDLPDFYLLMGNSCNNNSGQSAQIALSPSQYSFKVDQGAQQGQWVLAFQVLDGIGGLLVGSTFMDLFYTSFNYQQENGHLIQGDMALYTKTSGSSPAGISCVANPNPSPVTGTWYNSYCSQMMLAANSGGGVNGSYTSHTGSTGTSVINGWLGEQSSSAATLYGIPLALGIQWRLINQPIANLDPTWHWVSSFSGQYHPAQIIVEKGQSPYPLPETLTITNALVATANLAGYTNNAPVMWPQTLTFTRNPPGYCKPIPPTTPISFTGTVADYISGTWTNTQESMTLQASPDTGIVTGTYTDSQQQQYQVAGYFDNLPVDASMAQQGVALTARNSSGSLLSLAGGVDLKNSMQMLLWQDRLTSTTWTGRFTESTLDKKTWTRVMPVSASSP